MPKSVVCPECYFENPGHAKYCIECGRVLGSYVGTGKGLGAQGERKRVTALFSDLSEYTAMTEEFDPEEIREMKKGLYSGIRKVAGNYGGFIESFVGDGVLVLFGFPWAREDTPVRAIQAAIRIHRFVKFISPRYERRPGRRLTMHSGINTGLIVTGEAGRERETFAVTGEAVNVASRLSVLANADEILVGVETYSLAKHSFSFQVLKPVRVKGITEPVQVYKLLPNPPSQLDKAKEKQVFSELVGRDRELERLQSRVEKVISGEGAVLNLTGEAGVGKSRLIAELKKRELMKHVSLLQGRAISMGENLSYYPVIDLLKRWAGIIREDSESSALNKLKYAIAKIHPEETEEILPFVATLMGIKLSSEYARRIKGIEGDALERLILKNIRELVIKACEQRPTVFVLEDLHWADASSIELLDVLYRLAEKHSLLFVNIFRQNYLEKKHHKMTSIVERLGVRFEHLELQPLDKKNSESLISNILDIKGLPYQLKNSIIERTGGNPFFLEEVARYFMDSGAVIQTRRGFEVTDKIFSAVIPPTIQDLLTARIDRLEERTRQLVKVASVVGQSFFDRIIKEVADDIDNVDERLEYLKAAQLIRQSQHMGELEYIFKHALVQEAAYASTLLQQRKSIHQKVARSIERLFWDKLQEFYGMLAFHYSKGEEFEKAEEYMIKAGEEALKTSASSEALHYYKDVIKLYTERFGDSIDLKKMSFLEENLAFAFYYRGDQAEAMRYFNTTLSRLGIRENKNSFFMFLELVCNLLKVVLYLYLPLKKGEKIPTDRETRIINIILAKGHLLALIDPKKMFANTLLGFTECFKYNLSKSQVALNGISGGSALFSFTGLSFSLGKRSLNYVRKNLSTSNDNVSLYYYKMFETIHDYLTGNWDNDLGEDFIDYNIKIGEIYCAATHLLYIGYIYLYRGEFDYTKSIIEKLHLISEQFNTDHAAVMYYTLKALLLKKQARLQEASETINKGLDLAQKIGLTNRILSFLGMQFQVQVMLDHPARTEEILARCKAIISEQRNVTPYYYSSFLLGNFLYDLNRLEKSLLSEDIPARSKYRSLALKSGKRLIKNSEKIVSEKATAFCLMGRFYWFDGSPDKAVQFWVRALQEGELLGLRPDIASTYFEVGKRLQESQGKYNRFQGKQGKNCLEKARTLFQKMDIELDIEERFIS